MKAVKKVFITILALIILAAIALLVYRMVNKTPSENLPASHRVAAIMDDGGCAMCHGDKPLPKYAEWPVIGKTVKRDAASGMLHYDMSQTYKSLMANEAVGEVDMAKIEKCIEDGTMPPHNYYVMHWGSQITRPKKEIILGWAKDNRAKYFSNGLAAEQFANEPVQPIVGIIPTDPAKVALGNKLFHDPRLSIDNTISCASCHELTTAGVDNKQYSEGVGSQFGGVNAPTVYNAVFNFVQFWDGRAANLAAQAAGPPLNPVEMACESFDQIIFKLKLDKPFSEEFYKVYPEGYSEETITDAIAEFEKTLLTPDCRFDKYLKGDTLVITIEEKEGYDLFKQHKCATCHAGDLMGGKSYEYMGQAADYFADRGIQETNEDNGRFKETSIERDRHRFKTPGLRNITLTGPYYHDGTQKELRMAIYNMAKYQLGVELTVPELEKMEKFMGTLTGQYQGAYLTNAK